MKPEQKARHQIDVLLEDAGWKVQDKEQLNFGASKGIAVREFPLKSGPADYLLVVNRKAFGVVEAKPYGTTLSGVAEQSQDYLSGLYSNIPSIQIPLPFHLQELRHSSGTLGIRILAHVAYSHFINQRLWMDIKF